MVVVMEAQAPAGAIEAVVSYLVAMGADVHRSSGQTRTLLGVVGSVGPSDAAVIAEMAGVAQVVRVSEPYKLASRRFRMESSIVEGSWGAIGGVRPWIAVEVIGADRALSGDASASLPYEVAAGGHFDAAVTRAPEGPDSVGSLACLSLHHQRMGSKWAVRFVTREPSMGVNAWLEAAERELVRGTDQVVLLEAGGLLPDGTPTLEITNIPRVRAATHLPLVVDIPRIAGRRQHVASLASAVVAAGASGVILRAWAGSGDQAPRVPSTLRWDEAVEVAERLRAIGEAVRG
jgi:3-deoxy-7-phosphoheptulonate synthase